MQSDERAATLSGPAGDWPEGAWQLTAPESHVLLNGPAAGSDAFKLAVLELVARGVLRVVDVEQQGAFGRKRKVTVLARGANQTAPRERALAGVWGLYTETKAQTFADGTSGVPVDGFAQRAGGRYKPIGKFVTAEVLPALIERGLYRTEQGRTLFIFPTTKHVLTPAGEAARADLRRWMELGERHMGEWVEETPSRALAYASAAGAAVLLMAPLYPQLQRLGQQVRPDDLDSDRDFGDDYSGVNSLEATSFDFDLSAFDGLDSAFSAIDAGVDAGTDSGGSDSGSDGGDSGSSSD